MMVTGFLLIAVLAISVTYIHANEDDLSSAYSSFNFDESNIPHIMNKDIYNQLFQMLSQPISDPDSEGPRLLLTELLLLTNPENPLESEIKTNPDIVMPTAVNISFPSHLGLPDTCSNKVCSMLEYFMSCKGINFGFTKTCARYFLGTVYGCPIFPGPGNIYNAPSVCLQQYITFLMKLLAASKGQTSALLNSFVGYLKDPSFSTNVCGRQCYQNYQTASNDMYLNCRSVISKNATTYKLINLVSNYQQFRNQACDINSAKLNCFQTFQTLVSKSSGSVNLFDFTCNYYNLNNSDYNVIPAKNNTQLLAKLCYGFSFLGCCASSGITMFSSNQMNTSNLVIFPPCLLSYLTEHCPQVPLNNLCQNGSIASQSIIQGSIFLTKSKWNLAKYPNFYNKNMVLQTQALISYILDGIFNLNVEPYNFQTLYPFQIMIVDYKYYNHTQALTQNTPNPVYYPIGEDYSLSTGVNFTYQINVQNLNSSQLMYLNTILSSPKFTGALTSVFNSTITKSNVKGAPVLLPAAPLDVAHNSASSTSMSVLLMGVSMISCVVMMMMA